jgi:hypothetical protein
VGVSGSDMARAYPARAVSDRQSSS